MAAVTHLFRLVWGGRLFTAEQWSCSLHIDGPGPINIAASTFGAPLTAWVQRASSLISQAAKLDVVKFNEIAPATGRYVLPTTNALEQNDLGTGTLSMLPGQCAMAISLRTALARGRGHAGRFYAPVGAVTVDAEGRISAASAGGMATSAATLVNDLNDIVTSGGGRVVVFSKVAQTVEPVTGIAVGRVIDTMRSRRTSLLEDHQQTAVA